MLFSDGFDVYMTLGGRPHWGQHCTLHYSGCSNKYVLQCCIKIIWRTHRSPPYFSVSQISVRLREARPRDQRPHLRPSPLGLHLWIPGSPGQRKQTSFGRAAGRIRIVPVAGAHQGRRMKHWTQFNIVFLVCRKSQVWGWWLTERKVCIQVWITQYYDIERVFWISYTDSNKWCGI